MCTCRDETLDEFMALHHGALMRREARHNMMLSLLMEAATDQDMPLRLWSLGDGGACALRAGAHNIVLGDLIADQCSVLAAATVKLDPPGVVGPDLTAKWYADAATAHGLRFAEPMPQRIHRLDEPPARPHVPGSARIVTVEDLPLFHAWFSAFCAEAVPDDPAPDEAVSRRTILDRDCLFWLVDGVPVSMAARTRQTPSAGIMSLVYTPPHHRGHGYAGAATAEVATRILASGKREVCLYTDLRNPASNRCYAKIGFVPVCDALYYTRPKE